MSTPAAIRTRHGWTMLDTQSPPRVLETRPIQLRGLRPGSSVRIGQKPFDVDDHGQLEVRLSQDPYLGGHVGLVTMLVETPDGSSLITEVEIVPDKMSEPAYQVMRSELHRTWTNLIFSDRSPSAVSAGLPPARELWRRLDRPIMDILDQPNEVITVGVEPRRFANIRRRELTPAIVRAGMHNRSALTRTLQRSTVTPENQMCAATLRLLRSHASNDPSATDIVDRIDRLLHQPVFTLSPKPLRRVTWGMRSDPRYRRVLAVHRLLERPELDPTEGPGELRLGVPALTRLYEYWVYLKIIEHAIERFGPPPAGQLDQLAVPVRGNRHRLILNEGTTITLPGPIHIAFEPRITSGGDGWMGIEYVPHPDQSKQQLLATPDVAILDLREPRAPRAIIIDAKYVGRHFVELAAATIHHKYARMRLDGVPIVENVLAAHPHQGLSAQWAGYGHFPMSPGAPTEIPLFDHEQVLTSLEG